MPSSTATSPISSRSSGPLTKRRGWQGARATAVRSATGLTAAACLRYAMAELRAAGVDSPALDAELLLAHVIGVTRTQLRAHPCRLVDQRERERFEGLL